MIHRLLARLRDLDRAMPGLLWATVELAAVGVVMLALGVALGWWLGDIARYAGAFR